MTFSLSGEGPSREVGGIKTSLVAVDDGSGSAEVAKSPRSGGHAVLCAGWGAVLDPPRMQNRGIELDLVPAGRKSRPPATLACVASRCPYRLAFPPTMERADEL